MSNALALGAVTAVIRSLLENGLIRQGIAGSLGETPRITALAPELEEGGRGSQGKDRLNLFMYQATPNPGWRNVGTRTRNSDGDRVANPPLALDLHYSLTAYSQETFHADIMLGYAMLLLHETPVLSRDAIRNVLRNLATSNRPAERALATSDLADQVEQIKILPQVTTLEEISRFWSALQTPYRPSALYQVSVVLLEMKRSTKSALPVLKRNVYVTPFEQPLIETVESSEGDRQPITLDKTLIIKGQRLQADATRVQIGSTNIPLNTNAIAETQIQIGLATLEPTVANTLRAGVQPIQVIHDLILGTPGDPHRGFESNMAAFILRPRILRDSSNRYQIQISPVQLESGGRQIRNVTIALSPVVGQSQRIILLLNEWQGTRSYSFEATPRSQDSNILVIPISANIPAGTYLVRVQIDGAESPLDVDTQPESPNYNQFTGTPNLVIS